MVQLCLLGLYLGIETAPSDGKERDGIETVKIGPFFFSGFNAIPAKVSKGIIMISAPWWIFFYLLQTDSAEFFYYE